MTLSTSRIVISGETPHPHERAAIDFVIETLPNTDPYHVWALTELLDPSTGRLYELDLVVLGYSAIYLIEVKSGPGLYTGDTLDWSRLAPGESRPRYLENPLRLTNHKAKLLASRLKLQMAQTSQSRAQSRARSGSAARPAAYTTSEAPFVQPLIFLSAPETELQLRFAPLGDVAVVTRRTLLDAVKFGRFPGAPGPNARERPRIDAPTTRDVAQALSAIGLRARRGKAMVGAYELGPVLSDGPGYQDRLARHRDTPTIARRARTYAVPQASSIERRQQLRRAADRDAQILHEVREHPNILRFADYIADAELGPTVLFDAFEGAIPLDAFLRRAELDTPLTFWDRVTLIEQVARALSYCHKRGIVHGALSPEAVLVRRHPDTQALEARVMNFQLGLGPTIDATTHWSALGAEPWAVYQAPELREDPTLRRPVSDLFSLGALAYLIFTGRAPGTSAAQVDQYLAQHRRLDPRAIDDGLDEKLADLIAELTDRNPLHRIDDADDWLDFLLSEVTRPSTDTPNDEKNPLEAQPGDLFCKGLDNELEVEAVSRDRTVHPTAGSQAAPASHAVLGQGATSRVLQVRRTSDQRTYALKISLAPEHDERLEDEAKELERLRHPRIVQLVARYQLGGRPALLLTLAGTETLHRLLAREGTVSLELAARYGDDLLSGLAYLEELGILHRDLKPANLGVGSLNNKALHLTLFDFSLASAPPSDIQVGTASYRDPFLRLRGTWDTAAERWSAAVTLHEMLTGIRPSFDRPVLDPEATLLIAAERFDPAVREPLRVFFETALAKDTDLRFTSADAMRRAWLQATAPLGALSPIRAGRQLSGGLAGPSGSEAPGGARADGAGVADVAANPDSKAPLEGLGPTTPIEALPLSVRAKNALDRAGFLTALDLLGLADNRLSAIRGIGRGVAQEIHELRDRWQKAHAETAAPKPFFPGYRGEDAGLSATGLDGRAQSALTDAGLTTLSAIAESPAPQVNALAQRFGFDASALLGLLGLRHAEADQLSRPTTVAGWVEALLSPKKKGQKHPRELFGLEGPLVGTLGASVRELASALEVTAAAIYIALGKAREQWAAHPAFTELAGRIHDELAQAGGVMPLHALGRALLTGLHSGFGAEVPEAMALTAAAALVRVVAEVEKDTLDGLRQTRLDGGRGLWLVASDAHGQALAALGEAADQLAARSIVAGPSEAQRVFSDAAAQTPLMGLPVERLADIAAAASRNAARSARLEIYPRHMPAERALTLSASQLRPGLTAAEIARRVALRYPEAEPLPERPALDGLLAPHGLVFDDRLGVYLRLGEEASTQLSSRVPTQRERFRTALPTERLSMDPDAVSAREFDALLKNAAERHELRVLGVSPAHARMAALALGQRLGTEPIAFDQRLVAAIQVEMKKAGIMNDDVVHQADRQGPSGPAWKNLIRLATLAADGLAKTLLAETRPVLLTQPGLIGRYRLDALVGALLSGPRKAPVFLLVPSRDTDAIPAIQVPHGTAGTGGAPGTPGTPGKTAPQWADYALPGLIRSQVLWVPLEWLTNVHNRAA